MNNIRFKALLITPFGFFDVDPIGISKIKKTDDQDDGSIFFRKSTYEGKLTFMGNDYGRLLEWEQSDKRDRKVTLVIWENVNAVWVERLRYIVSPELIEWDKDHCLCYLSFNKTESKFDGYNKYKDVEFNLFELTGTRLQWHLEPEQPADPIFMQVENGLILKDILQILLQKGSPGMIVKSKFFAWNDTQDYAIGNNDKLTKMILAQNSDIYNRQLHTFNPVPDPATVMNCTLGQIVTSLCDMFNLKCDIEGFNTFRIEHISWFDSISPVTVVANTGDNYQINKGRLKKYAYDKSRLYKAQNLTTRNKFNRPDFVGKVISFNTYNIEAEDMNTLNSIFNTDVDPFLSESIEFNLNEGIFLGAVDGGNALYRLDYIFGANPDPKNNNQLGWAYLAQDYHLHGKPFATGQVNDVDVTFTTRQNKVQNNIRIKDCSNSLALINGTVTTDIGDGRVIKCEKELGSIWILATLSFEQGDLTIKSAPTATDDNDFITAIDTVLDTIAQALDPLTANDTPNTAIVYAETKPTECGGTVVIKTNGHFIYTPPAGYAGYDRFDYYITYAGGTDTGTCKILIN